MCSGTLGIVMKSNYTIALKRGIRLWTKDIRCSWHPNSIVASTFYMLYQTRKMAIIILPKRAGKSFTATSLMVTC